MNPHTQHEMVVANAGSGKTYRLTTRAIALLALDVEPRKIAALTFTKMAAGEFVDQLVERLAKAASDPSACAGLRADTGVESLDSARCTLILRRFVNQMSALCMGTIDSLFGKIARSFPLEAGLSGDLALLTQTDIESARERATATSFHENATDPARFEAFVELIRIQSRRSGERDVFGQILKATENLHAQFLATPQDAAWGNRKRIWPGSCAVLDAGPLDHALAEFITEFDATPDPLDEDCIAGWHEIFDTLRSQKAGQTMSVATKKIFKDRLDKVCVSKDGLRYIPLGRGKKSQLILHEPLESARIGLIRALLKPEFESLIKRSAALYAFMAEFESIYDSLTRSNGQVTFSDITSMLAKLVRDEAWIATAGYRMDACYDHWLLDEFQDTSRDQWAVLSAFIDEIIQDSEGQRSLFYVGDTKQALYLWRAGDPKLFFEIFDKYNSGSSPIIHETGLIQSYRSGPEILAAVNRVFGNLDRIYADLGLPEQAIERWQKAWHDHEPAEGFAPPSSFVQWKTVKKSGKPDAGETEDEFVEVTSEDAAMIDILRGSEPWKRGLECGILVRSNKNGEHVAALLQSENIPVSLQGNANPCLDNPLGIAMASGFRSVIYPSDRLAFATFAGYPIAAPLLAEGETSFRERTLRSVFESGYAETCRAWLSGDQLTDEPFLAERALAFVAAAAEFDTKRGPSDGIPQFLAFIEGRLIQEAECQGVVRVMTVHQAKGLTFDMAILVHMGSLVKDSLADNLVLGGGRPPTWGLLLPNKEIGSYDETIQSARTSELTDLAYGSLCALYVAMTRPRHALYIVTEEVGAKSVAKTFARLLSFTLNGTDNGFEAGDAGWFKAFEMLPDCKTERLGITSPQQSRGLTPLSLGNSLLPTASTGLSVN